MTTPAEAKCAELAEELKGLGLKGILVSMARDGQLLEAKCEMPSCYCPKGRKVFDPIGTMPDNWVPTEDHYPVLKSKGGKRIPSNMRFAHKRCNNADRYRRTQIGKMLDDGKPLEDIANVLTEKGIPRPHGTTTWTAAVVRKSIVA